MRLLIESTKGFKDYDVFMRAMGVVMGQMKDSDGSLDVFSVGPHKLNAMASEFFNVAENSLKARGIKHSFNILPQSVPEMMITRFNYMAYLSNPENTKLSKLTKLAEDNGVEVGIFRY